MPAARYETLSIFVAADDQFVARCGRSGYELERSSYRSSLGRPTYAYGRDCRQLGDALLFDMTIQVLPIWNSVRTLAAAE